MQKTHLVVWLAIFWTICQLTALSSAQAQDKDASFEYEEKIDALVKPYVENDKVFAVSVAAIADGQVWFGNYGQLSKSDTGKPTSNTVYEIGSISKVFTSLLLADAIKSGELELTTPIGKVMSELKDTDFGKNVTVKHLATHTSGLPKMPNNWKPADMTAPYIDYDRKLLNEYITSLKMSDLELGKNNYSNVGAGLLGDSLSAKFDEPYEILLRDRILVPLKMDDTALQLSSDQQKRFAPPHNGLMMPDHVWEFDAFAGAGAIRSTSADMAKFIQANLAPPESEISEVLNLAWDQQLDAAGGQPAMGLGWHIGSNGTTRWHNGQTGGYHSMILVNRELNAGVIVLCNTAIGDIDRLGTNIFETVIGKNPPPRDFADEKTAGVVIDQADVDRLAGKYQLAPELILEVVAKKNRLAVKLTGQSFLDVEPVNKTLWRLTEVEAKLKFRLPNKGPASSVTLLQNGNEQKAKRIKK